MSSVAYYPLPIMKPRFVLAILSIVVVFSATADAQVSFKQDSITRSGKQYRYEITARYPILQGVGSDVFNDSIKQFIRSQVDTFAHNFAEDYKEFPDTTDVDSADQNCCDSYLEINDTIAFANASFVNVLFTHDFYFHLSAHPNMFFATKLFSLRTKKMLTLGDLFKPGSKYLRRISAYCLTDVTKQMRVREEDSSNVADEDVDVFRFGLTAKGDNFKCFTLSDSGITFYFAPYQVAAYVFGYFEVMVPYEKLKDILRKEIGLGELVK